MSFGEANIMNEAAFGNDAASKTFPLVSRIPIEVFALNDSEEVLPDELEPPKPPNPPKPPDLPDEPNITNGCVADFAEEVSPISSHPTSKRVAPSPITNSPSISMGDSEPELMP